MVVSSCQSPMHRASKIFARLQLQVKYELNSFDTYGCGAPGSSGRIMKRHDFELGMGCDFTRHDFLNSITSLENFSQEIPKWVNIADQMM